MCTAKRAVAEGILKMYMRISGKPHEECAVFGVSTLRDEAAGITYNGLLSLQHRGQESAGIAVTLGGKILYYKNVGLVNEVFSGRVLKKLTSGKIAVVTPAIQLRAGTPLKMPAP